MLQNRHRNNEKFQNVVYIENNNMISATIRSKVKKQCYKIRKKLPVFANTQVWLAKWVKVVVGRYHFNIQ